MLIKLESYRHETRCLRLLRVTKTKIVTRSAAGDQSWNRKTGYFIPYVPFYTWHVSKESLDLVDSLYGNEGELLTDDQDN